MENMEVEAAEERMPRYSSDSDVPEDCQRRSSDGTWPQENLILNMSEQELKAALDVRGVDREFSTGEAYLRDLLQKHWVGPGAGTIFEKEQDAEDDEFTAWEVQVEHISMVEADLLSPPRGSPWSSMQGDEEPPSPLPADAHRHAGEEADNLAEMSEFSPRIVRASPPIPTNNSLGANSAPDLDTTTQSRDRLALPAPPMVRTASLMSERSSKRTSGAMGKQLSMYSTLSSRRDSWRRGPVMGKQVSILSSRTSARHSRTSANLGQSGVQSTTSSRPSGSRQQMQMTKTASRHSYMSNASRLSRRFNPLLIFQRENTALSDVTKASTIPSVLVGMEGLRTDTPETTFACVEGQYDFESKLGEGAFGIVWKARHMESGGLFAVKAIQLTTETSIEAAGQELALIKRLKNPYIVKLHHIVQQRDHLFLAIDLCTGGDLCKFLHDYWHHPDRNQQFASNLKQGLPLGLPASIIAPWAWQMLVAVAYLHRNRIVHRDIKAANFMRKEDRPGSKIQLIDFGYAVRYHTNQVLERQVGTVRYMAPEVISAAYTEKYDVWSLGVLIFLLVLNKYPYGGRNIGEVVQSIDRGKRSDQQKDWQLAPPQLHELVDLMLTRDYMDRPSAKELLRSNAWLRKKGRPAKQGGACGCTVS